MPQAKPIISDDTVAALTGASICPYVTLTGSVDCSSSPPIDIAAVSTLAHKAGAVVVVDNVFATPLLQKPLAFGADIVVYSATKHIDGQGRCLGGVILGTAKYINETLQPFIRHTGPSLSPVNAWILLKGLETLDLRLQRHCDSAEKVAKALQGHAKLNDVLYPTLRDFPQVDLAKKQMKSGGSIISIDLKGGKDASFRFLNALKLVLISNNLGDSKSLATHPMTTTHQRLTAEQKAAQGITPGLVRLSIVNLAGMPSIVYGLFGLGMFVMFLNMGQSLAAGWFTLGSWPLPIVIIAST
ncbi:MAG: hypothetical protein HC918_08960 [Oscillatoriales cyanobacterium SM2_1_8]|nr:hypothetical protein [Oscillatoriales cyanobacterium SM2_1_8]